MEWLSRLKQTVTRNVEVVADTPTFRGAVEIITPEGDRVWIATEPAVVKLIPEGAVFFLGEEILQLQQAGRQAAKVAMLVKQVFPGAGPVRIEAIEG